VKQQGAGNGKTYGIVQLLQHPKYEHYETFVYLTKQHSAVHVIHEEINTQKDRGDLSDIIIIKDETVTKKHIIQFTNTRINKKRKIIIGTFDSFVWALGDQHCKGVNKFLQMVNSIIDDELRCANNGDIKYANGIRLNKKLLLIGDEMQDLHENYMKAVIKIMNERYVDFFAVGDKLQSISIEKNAFTYFSDLYSTEMMNVWEYKPRNICRRFKSPQLINFVNSMIPFKKYNLPEIKMSKEEYDSNALCFIEGKRVFEDNKSLKDEEVDKIMEKYIMEVEKNGCKSNDFLIVTPFVAKNPLVEALHDSIREYWNNKLGISKKYVKHSVFHKSGEGTSIDLSESNNCTRIVSIHSSKGDGRDIVFVIGISEESLKKYSKESENLIYDSLLHVALTRMKKKLYFRIEPNGDHIHRRIQQYQYDTKDMHDIKPVFKISRKISLGELAQNDNLREKTFIECREKIIKFSAYKDINDPLLRQKGQDKINKELIDYKHHCIRYAIFKILIIIKIMNDNIDNNDRSYQQIYQILKHKYKIRKFDLAKEYYAFLRKKEGDREDIMPVLKCKNANEYYEYITKLINKIRQKINEYRDRHVPIKLDLIESICLHYMMETCDQGQFSALPVSDMYDIVDIYIKTTGKNLQLNITDHYDKIAKVDNIYEEFKKKYPNLRWNIDHIIFMENNNNTLNVYKKFALVGYDEKNVVICYIKPQFSTLNFNEVMMDSIFGTYLLMNVKNDSEEKNRGPSDYEKFYGKKIITCVFTLDMNVPYFFDWIDASGKNLIETEQDFIKSIIKQNMICAYKMKHSAVYMFYMYWIKIHKLKDPNPVKVIMGVKKEYDNHCNKFFIEFPEYINDFFYNIQNKVKKGEKKGKGNEIISNYDDQTYFMKKLDKKLLETIEDFFGE